MVRYPMMTYGSVLACRAVLAYGVVLADALCWLPPPCWPTALCWSADQCCLLARPLFRLVWHYMDPVVTRSGLKTTMDHACLGRSACHHYHIDDDGHAVFFAIPRPLATADHFIPRNTKRYTTIAGGTANYASANGATIGGGWHNHAEALLATIGGGDMNTAYGECVVARTRVVVSVVASFVVFVVVVESGRQ
jgi:hypothetical protein